MASGRSNRGSHVQHALDRAKWDCDGVRDELYAYVQETLATSQAVVVIDETGFREIWRQVGRCAVAIQWHGWADRKLPGGVFLAYASSRGHLLLDRELYLPHRWIADPARCREARVPEEVTFATKPE